MLGTLKLPVRGKKHFLVVGGPYVEKPQHMVGVKMAREKRLHNDGSLEIDIPTQDFKTPPKLQMEEGLIKAVDAIVAGKPLYVGCMAGRGRTGLFLSILARCFGIENPVEYVREHYYAHAVETEEQYRYVMEFPIPRRMKSKLWLAKFKSYFTSKELLTKAEE